MKRVNRSKRAALGHRNLDRFIPCRANMDFSLSYYLLKQADKDAEPIEATSILYQEPEKLNTETYRTLLEQAFNIHDTRILPLFPQKGRKKKDVEKLWPCSPRSNPSIRSSITILDLPNLNEHFYMNLIDWSSSNYVTAALNRTVYLYYPPTHDTIKIELQHSGMSVKWSPDGTRLAIGERHGSLKLWDRKQAKFVCADSACCFFKSCSVTAIEWHPNKNLLFAGCTNGALKVYTSNLNWLRAITPHDKQIVTLMCSCDGKYLASSSMDGTFAVFSLFNPAVMCDYLLRVNFGSPVRALAWHPWKSGLLCVGSLSGLMNLWDISRLKMVAESKPATKPGDTNFLLNMTFNKISGELVTSHLIEGPGHSGEDGGETQINVLASFDKVVDRMQGHIGWVLYLKWNPDSTLLATAGVDETLQLWNFIPKQEQKQKQKKKTFCVGATESSLTLKFSSMVIR